MEDFVGRRRELALLSQDLAAVRKENRGRFVLIRGRRRVGKSRLVEEFLRREQARAVFFAATRGRPREQELQLFGQAVGASRLAAAPSVEAGARFQTWDAALAVIAGSSTKGDPSVVVIDELPYLIQGDPSVEGALQTAWDRFLERAPVLVIVVGSDVAMMEALTGYGRPLFDRPTRTIRLQPLTPAEISAMLPLEPADALDAYLVIGGFPLLARSWKGAGDLATFLRRELHDPTSPLIVSGERIVAAEFPPDTQARRVLVAIGSGERTFTGISRGAGIPHQSLDRALIVLAEKRVIDRVLPLSSKPSRDTRYLVADPSLRFWLRFIEPGLGEIERERGDLVLARIRAQWGEYRGRAIEPLVREAVGRLLPNERFGEAAHIGSYWNRTGDIEVDLVGTAEPGRSRRVELVGSIKWRERARFDERDLAALSALRPKVPGADESAILVGVSRSGFSAAGLAASLGPGDLLAAWSI